MYYVILDWQNLWGPFWLMRHSRIFSHAMNITVGVLALQGAFREHLNLLRKASEAIYDHVPDARLNTVFTFREVRTEQELLLCDALIIPGGESTTISLVAARSNILELLRDFVKYDFPQHRFSLSDHDAGSIENQPGALVLA